MVEPLRLVEPLALAVAIGLVAGLVPAWRAARLVSVSGSPALDAGSG